MIMPANSSAMHAGWLCGRYPGRIGWLLSPGGWRQPHRFLPYAIDNGAFSAWKNGAEWDEAAFYGHLDVAAKCGRKPLWVVVPDKVADRDETLRMWERHSPRIAAYGWPLAFAVQDGMIPDDVPPEAGVVFVGGSMQWKWRSLPLWRITGKIVHVARVNTYRLLWMAHNAGAASCDGTGWYRGDRQQLQGLEQYLAESSRGGSAQQEMWK